MTQDQNSDTELGPGLDLELLVWNGHFNYGNTLFPIGGSHTKRGKVTIVL